MEETEEAEAAKEELWGGGPQAHTGRTEVPDEKKVCGAAETEWSWEVEWRAEDLERTEQERRRWTAQEGNEWKTH